MSSSRGTLERIGNRVPVPQPAFDRLMRRRDRKRRNQRIGTIVLALVIAALAIGGSLRVFHRSFEPQPANPGLDHSFGSDGRVTTSISPGGDTVHAIAVQPDGKILAVGSSGSKAEWALARYDADGSLDSTFGEGGIITTDITSNEDEAFAVAIQIDGKIVVAGAADTYARFALARYNTDGTLDQTFGTGGEVTTDFTSGHSDFARNVAIQADGKIVVGGPSNDAGASEFALVRYNADGTLDASFGDGGKVTTGFHARDDDWDLTIQTDGKIVAAGYGAGTFAVARYRRDGTLDPAFGTGGQVSDIGGAAFGVAVQPDGKIVLGGTSDSKFALARYDANGRIDRTFGKRGLLTSDVLAWAAGARIVVQPDGKIVAAGGDKPQPGFAVARFNADGTLDPTFGTNGVITSDFGPDFSSTSSSQVAIEPEGNIVVAGTATRSASDSDFALARYLATSRPASTPDASNAPGFPWYLAFAAVVGVLLVVRIRLRRRA